MQDNDPVFIEIPENDKPLSFVGELAVSALALCAFVFIISVAFIFGG
jgi:hypothetical protein